MARVEIRIVVADAPRIVREGIARLLSDVPGFEVVGEAASGQEALEKVLTLSPDVLVIEGSFPGTDGIETARLVRESHPRTEVMVLTALRGEEALRRALGVGVRAYVLKDCAPSDLAEGVRRAAHGDYHVAGSTERDPVAAYVEPSLRSQRPGGLVTPRERELAVLLADGYSTKEAAAALNISVKTAETHRTSIMRKLGARNVADVVKYCIRNGLIDV